MKTIEYRVQYTGKLTGRGNRDDSPNGVEYEVVSVRARDINSGFTKALKTAQQPLGSGRYREIGTIEFWQIP